MAEVLTQNAEFELQRGEETRAHRPTSLVRSHSFKYYIHDSVPTLRFQLVGDLRATNLAELNGSWETARTTLGLRRFVLDAIQLYSTDAEGRSWLVKMKDAGAAFLPATYLDPATTAVKVQAESEAVCLSILGRLMGMIRGER